MQAASTYDVFLLYLGYFIYDSPVPATFLRAKPPIVPHAAPFAPRDISTYKAEECLMVEITSEIGKGASGMKHGGTLEAEIPGSVPVDVVVILAFNEEQQDILEHEYEVLGRLRS